MVKSFLEFYENKDIIFERNDKKIVAIYPGRFQLPHKGHKFVYNTLERQFGEVYISTSNKVELPKSPFNFREKKKMLSFLGIPQRKIVQVKNPYLATEILDNYDDDTVVIFGVGRKDYDRFPFKKKKDGSEPYFQPYDKNKNNLKGKSEHAYIMILPTHTFDVMGKPATSASEMRKEFASLDEEKQKEFIKDLYGKYSKQIHTLLTKKLS